MNEDLIKFLECENYHPIYKHKLNLIELFNNLNDQVEKKIVNKGEDDNFIIFNYTSKCQNLNLWDKYNLLARGIIFDKNDKTIAALPFPKFFNYSEYPITEIRSFAATCKFDGSLGIAFYDKYLDKWRFATRGSLVSEQAKWAEKWLNKNIEIENLNKDYTYLFEIVYNENKIVVNYDFEGLVLLGSYSKIDYRELDYENLKNIARQTGVRFSEIINFETFEEIFRKSEKIKCDKEEGWVVKLNGNLRVKIKGVEYCKLHRILSGITHNAILKKLIDGINVDEYYANEVPEEYLNNFKEIYAELKSKYDEIEKKANEEYEKTKNMADKELGLKIKKGDIKLDFSNFVFRIRKSKLDDKFIWQFIDKNYQFT